MDIINREKLNDCLSKVDWNSTIRSSIYVLCCAIMSYQVTFSCLDFYEYKTVVQIKISKSDQLEIPSISVCRKMRTQEYLDILRNKDPEFAKKFAKKVKNSGESVENSAEEESSSESTALEILAKYLEDDKRDAKSFFDLIQESLTVKCTDVQSHYPIGCNIKAEIINSFTQKRICATFFSKLYVNFNKNQSNFSISNNSSEKANLQESMFAWLSIQNPRNDVYVYIHTTKSMPDINLYDLEMTRSRIFSNKTYGILYSKYYVNRLETPYQTNCYNYTRNRVLPDDPLSEFGCIERCKKRFWKNRTSHRCLPIDLVFIIESDDRFETICNCTVKPCDIRLNNCIVCEESKTTEYKKWMTNCENNCLQDCYEEYYTKDMFELRDDFRQMLWNKFHIYEEGVGINTTIVFLAAKYMEEISYTHSPRMGQFDFFAAMGGLFSLWIGASVMTIYDVLYAIFKIGKNIRQKAMDEKLIFWKLNKLTDKVLKDQKRRASWRSRYDRRARADITKYNNKY